MVVIGGPSRAGSPRSRSLGRPHPRPGADEPDRPVHVVDQVGQPDLHPGSRQADGAHHEFHRPLLPGEDVLDGRTNPRLPAVGAGDVPRHRLARRLLAVDARAEAVARQVSLVGLRAIGGIRPDVAGGVGFRQETGQLCTVCPAASVAVQVRISPWRRSMPMWFL